MKKRKLKKIIKRKQDRIESLEHITLSWVDDYDELQEKHEDLKAMHRGVLTIMNIGDTDEHEG